MMVRGLSTSFLSIRRFSRVHKKWHETKRKLFSETPSLRVILCREGETVRCLLFVMKPREQIIERVLKWNTFTPADEGSTKAAKKHLSLCFLFASAARSRLFASFSRKSECSRFLFSLTSLSSFLSSRVFFLKSGRKSICWRCFFHSRTHERFPPQNHSQTTSSYISLYSHWRTTNTITTHISFITRGGAQTQTRVFAAAAAAALSLSLALLLFERKRARKVPFF